MKKFRLLTLLALLMTVATGAWAQEQSETIATTANEVEGTHFTISNNGGYVNAQGMNADEGITVTAKNGETITKVFIICPVGYSNVHDYNTSISSGTKEVTDAGVINVTGVNASTFTFTCSDTSPQFSQFVVYYTEAPASYSVTMPQDTPDASNWTGKAGTATEFSALPLENVAVGDAVTLKYGGNRKVKTVTATTDAGGSPAPAGLTLDLATVTEATTVGDGYTVTGTLGANVKISIADGATVTLDGVTINGVDNSNYKWAGINCLGDATIILSGTNTVKGFYEEYPGIHVPQNKTLTIEGSGSLTASSNYYGCGIGGGCEIACGNIVIAGGTITATGGSGSAGIGGGKESSCGNISITGGTVTATGGKNAAGIGSGSEGSCGTVTITDGVTSVTATKGKDANYSIGAGNHGSCGTVTIGCTLDGGGNPVGGTTGQISTSPYTYQPSN